MSADRFDPGPPYAGESDLEDGPFAYSRHPDAAEIPPAEPDPGAKPRVTCRPAPSDAGWARCSLTAPPIDDWPGIRLELAFATDTLPFLQVLEDFRPGMNLIGVEPANTDRSPEGLSVLDPSADLAAGASRQYRLTLTLGTMTA